ncbi:sulfite oxidase-like oxidoreductase [Synechococcus sp. PCC 7502]|uniref:protein-methionine-sulfoxide reductase catalytic subunit MsrP n=1 Tax=Synechococcus sp. PCC 7502 TaxID=1173263 RepID=UPI00029FC374|nr:protein-methionine-sulfoxide reductase catalytic subunit MsrP [Synechococcus sp. PCC 7502]AFY74402.1 sulfite oxidase-like oxidoreductase [Synechococcus sp. PCC 7502]
MTLIKILPDWFLPENHATPESVFLNRRRFLKGLGLGAIGTGISTTVLGCNSTNQEAVKENLKSANLQALNFTKNPNFVLDRPLTDEAVAATYNNFYEFSSGKDVWRYVGNFEAHPWTVEINGLVNKPQTLAIEDLITKMPMEERLYRHRCVETWAMAVPWVGFSLKSLIQRVEPKSTAKFVKFTTFFRPKQVSRQDLQNYPYPYTEGLTMAEAMNDLAFLAVGIYGHELPKQHGAPIRLVVPWKYGFKSIKSIDKIEFIDRQPATFWNTLVANEYDFEANVNPHQPHPRWSQATERMLGTGERRKTTIYNGYANYVGGLYKA